MLLGSAGKVGNTVCSIGIDSKCLEYLFWGMRFNLLRMRTKGPDNFVFQQTSVPQDRALPHARMPLWQQPETDCVAVSRSHSLSKCDGLINCQSTSNVIEIDTSIQAYSNPTKWLKKLGTANQVSKTNDVPATGRPQREITNENRQPLLTLYERRNKEYTCSLETKTDYPTKKPIGTHLPLSFHNVGMRKHQGRNSAEGELGIHVLLDGRPAALVSVIQILEVH